VIACHYALADAVAQKIAALRGRAQPQARDVFDLHWLLAKKPPLPRLDAETRREAIERVFAFDAADFEGQVLQFLEPEERKPFEGAAALERIQLRVAEAIEHAP